MSFCVDFVYIVICNIELPSLGWLILTDVSQVTFVWQQQEDKWNTILFQLFLVIFY